jgi:hypothetical protein
MNKYAWFVSLVVLVLMSLACQTFAGGGSSPAASGGGDSANPSQPGDTGGSDSGGETDVDSELFPMPSDAESVTEMGNDTVIFQTGVSVDEAMNFYRDAYGKQGYEERDILTVKSDQAFSMVFDGHSSGKALIVQGADLGNGKINITISLQDI